MVDAAVKLEGIGHWYLPDQWLFRDINLTVRAGEAFAILGQNGCGKTTLLKIILGILAPRAGRALLGGGIGFVPQLFVSNFRYTVFDMVLMGRAGDVGMFRSPSRKDEDIVLESLEALGLSDLIGRAFDELSGGQRQMVIIARALASNATILVLDEPTSALDLRNQAAVLGLIKRLAHERKFTVIFTTHQPQHAFAVADRVMLMMGGERHIMGAVGDVMSEENLTRLYGVDVGRVCFERHGIVTEAVLPILEFRSRTII